MVLVDNTSGDLVVRLSNTEGAVLGERGPDRRRLTPFVIIEDLNGDGRQDLVVGDRITSTAQVFPNLFGAHTVVLSRDEVVTGIDFGNAFVAFFRQ